MNEDFIDLDPRYLQPSAPEPPKSNPYNIMLFGGAFVASWLLVAYLIFFSRNGGGVDPIPNPIVVQDVESVTRLATADYLEKKASINRLIAKEILEKKITNSGQLVTVMQSYQQQAYKLSNKPIDVLDEAMIPDDFSGKEQMLHDYFMKKAKGYE
jgi:hypothetical protein